VVCAAVGEAEASHVLVEPLAGSDTQREPAIGDHGRGGRRLSDDRGWYRTDGYVTPVARPIRSVFAAITGRTLQMNALWSCASSHGW
jgi:hypothetical protein